MGKDNYDDNYKDEIDYELLNDLANNKYVLKGQPRKILMSDEKINLIIQDKKKEYELMKQIKKLEQIKAAIIDKDPKKLENEYFKKFDCYTEKSKIKLEAEYIKSKMIEDKEKYSSYKNYEFNLILVNHILSSLDDISATDYDTVKQCLILIELDLKLDIAFFSELDNVYNMKKKRIDDNPETYRRGL